MRAYTELLVATCHKRGAFAMGGMAAFIPSRRDPEVNEVALAKVREDKEREAGDGFDGSWVAHPDLVPICLEVFDAVLGDRPNQLDRQRDDVTRRPPPSCSTSPSTAGEVTDAGLRGNVSVALRYIVVLAARQRRGRDRQPDGGRRHRGDLPLPALAVDRMPEARPTTGPRSPPNTSGPASRRSTPS